MCVPRRFTIVAAAIAMIGLISACSSSVDPVGNRNVNLQTDRTNYGPGSTVTVTVTNISADTVQVRSCRARLERQSAGQWQSTELPGDCVSMYTRLAPGASLTYGYVVPSDATPGTYRLLLPEVVSPDGMNVRAVDGSTNVFEILDLVTPHA